LLQETCPCSLSLSLSLFFCFFFPSCLYTLLQTLSCSGVCVFMLRERRAERDGAWRLTYYSFSRKLDVVRFCV
jgi:hypothetical protein